MRDLTHVASTRRSFLKHLLGGGVTLSATSAALQGCNIAICSTKQSLNFANWASAETATRQNINVALQDFEQQNSVQVNNIGMPFDDVYNQLAAMTHAGIPPDVMQLSGNWPAALGGIGALTDLRPFVSSFWQHDAFPDSFAAGTYKGALYAVPFSITPHGFWYNKALMTQAGLNPDAPPRTITELNQAMEVLRAKLPDNAYPLAIDTSVTEYALVGFWPWIWTFGGNPMVDNGRGKVSVNWSDEGTVAAFQWLQDAAQKGWTPIGQDIKEERSTMAFNRIVFKLDGPYLTGILGNLNPTAYGTVEQVNQQFGVTTTPLGPDITHPVTCADIHNLGISALARNKQLAWDLINFLTTSRTVITTFLIPEGGILPHSSYNTQQRFYAGAYNNAISQAFIHRVIPTMRAPAYSPTYCTTSLSVAQALQDIANGAAVRPRLSKLNEEVRALYI